MVLNKEVPKLKYYYEKDGERLGSYSSLWKNIKFTLDDIINSGLHIGSLVKCSVLGTTWSWSYTVKGHSIFNLKIIYFNLRLLLRRLNWRSVFFSDIVYANFNRSLVDFIEEWALKTGVMYVVGKWFRGGITNFVNFYAFLQKCRFDSYSFRKYSRYFCGVFQLSKAPDILFLSSNRDNFSRVLVKEAFNWNAVEMWLLNDSLVDPKHWSFVLPGNEKSRISLNFIYDLFFNQIVLGKMISLCHKDIILNQEDFFVEEKSKFKIFNEYDYKISTKKRFFDNENYFNRFLNWFSYMKQRDLEMTLNKRFEKWNGRYSWLGFKKHSSKAAWYFILTKRKVLRRLENFKSQRKLWAQRTKKLMLSKVLVNKPRLKKFVGWKCRKSVHFYKRIRHRFYKSPNYMNKIELFKKRTILYDDFKNYHISKQLNFYNFYKKVKKSQNLKMLFQQEFNKQLSLNFDRNDKLGSFVWEYFDGRNMENWWTIHKNLYKDIIQIRKKLIDGNEYQKNYKNQAIWEDMVQKFGSELFNFNKVILKNNYFNTSNRKIMFQRNLLFTNNFSNFENNCLHNENYFKQKNRITVINYKD